MNVNILYGMPRENIEDLIVKKEDLEVMLDYYSRSDRVAFESTLIRLKKIEDRIEFLKKRSLGE